MDDATFEIEGKVFEILNGSGLASLFSQSGSIYTVDRCTPGINFGELRKGQRIRCKVATPFNRVMHAESVA